MPMPRPELDRVRVPLVLQCTIERRGHADPIPNGTYVKCIYAEATAAMTSDLDDDVFTARRNGTRLRMNEAGVGSVICSRWHVCPLELCHGRIAPPGYNYNTGMHTPAHVSEVYEDLYYCVAFLKGLYWARFDWIEVITAPT